ncbi:MAG: glycosyltransferase [Chloroflexi bacterium]|nr:glycosyltransferase [Chloroflexota bacterium]
MKELTILIFSLRGGGLEKSILRLAIELKKQNVELDFLVANTIDSVYSVPDELHFVDLNASRILYTLYPLIKYLKKTKPKVLFSAGTPLNTIAILAKLITGYPKRLVVGERNHLSSIVRHSPRFRDKFRPYFVRFLYPLADQILAVSESVAEDVVTVGNLDKMKVCVAYNAFDIENIIAKSSEPTGVAWVDSQNTPTIINVGRLTRQKDHATLIRTFSLLRKKKVCRLIILGEGELRSALEDLVDELQIKDDVYMPGFVRNPYAYIARANIFALTSAWEGLPAVLIEALACGTPVVACDSPGGTAEILGRGLYGRLVSSRDPVSLADAILQELEAMKNPERLQLRARAFSAEHIIPDYLDFLVRSGQSETSPIL